MDEEGKQKLLVYHMGDWRAVQRTSWREQLVGMVVEIGVGAGDGGSMEVV